jgi:hypothetical protein
MYLFDPHGGRRRRALLRDQCVHSIHEIEAAVDILWHDLSTRTARLTAETKAMFSDDYAPDDVIEARVRSALGRVVSHPRSLHVTVQDGQTVLSGPILAPEVGHLLETVNEVHGVIAVENRLEVHPQAEHFPGLQGGSVRAAKLRRAAVEKNQGAPTTKLLIGLAGGLLVARAIKRHRLASLAVGALCVSLTARGLVKAAAEAQNQNSRGDDREGLRHDPIEHATLSGMMSTRAGS